jgi:hypothetical protein
VGKQRSQPKIKHAYSSPDKQPGLSVSLSRLCSICYTTSSALVELTPAGSLREKDIYNLWGGVLLDI